MEQIANGELNTSAQRYNFDVIQIVLPNNELARCSGCSCREFLNREEGVYCRACGQRREV